MPFTPFHMGPGLLVKAAAPRSVSLLAFGTVQIAIDLESLYYLTNGEVPVHRTLHTFLFGTAFAVGIGVAVFGIAWAIHRLVARRAAHLSIGRAIAVFAPELSASGILWGAVAGAVTHSLFDGIMHGDIHPFAPFTDANPLLGLLSWSALHLLCVALGVAGGAWLVSNRELWRPAIPESAPQTPK